MSAIAGLIYRDGRPAELRDLQRMLDAMAHRGPENIAVASGTAALGCRLRRPGATVSDIGPGLTIVADARIDNRADLIAQLRLPPTVDDSQVILESYRRWGEACIERFLGDFAFAIWDGEKGAVFCARDHFGIKPFYYSLTDGLFAFASEIPALLALPAVPRRLNDARVLDYLTLSFDHLDTTFYRDIQRLPPAHCLAVTPLGTSARRYWTLEPPEILRLRDDAEYAHAYRSIFEEAVRCRLHGAERVAALLSGGLDSSSVACTARSLLTGAGTTLPTISIVFDEPSEDDERPYQKAVLDLGGYEPHSVRGDANGPLFDIERMLAGLGQPYLGANLHLTWQTYPVARSAGADVILDGFDGDTTVSHGLGRLTELAASGRLPILLREAAALGRNYGASQRAFLRRLAVAPFLPVWMSRLWRRRRRQPDQSLGWALRADFCRRVGYSPGDGSGIVPVPRTEQDAHLYSLRRPLLSESVELTARAAQLFSVDARYPFFDLRLIDFCLSLPSEQKLRDGWTRWVMRSGMEGILPDAVRLRPSKSDATPHFVRAVRGLEAQRISAELDCASEQLSEYVDVDFLRARWERFLAKQTPADGQAVLQAVILDIWLRSSGF